MKTRPWPIIILAIIQILMPLFSLLMNAWIMGVTLPQYYKAFMHVKTGWEIFEFFALYPIAGVAVFLMKKWSYPVFICVMSWNIASNIIIWFRDYQNSLSPWIIIGITMVNLFFVTYYLLPTVRKIYFDRTLRWWETKPRFLLQIAAHFDSESQKGASCEVRDLSVGGAFIESDAQLNINDTVTMQLPIFGKEIPVKGVVVHKGAGSARSGYGVQFTDTKDSHHKIKSLIRTLDALGFELRWEKEPIYRSFSSWSKQIFTKKAWLPTQEL